MKYTIHGFSQQRALEFRKEIEKKGKKTTLKLNCDDLMLLRWFVDFFPKMTKKNIDGKEYAWVNYATVIADLPLLDIGIKSIYNKFTKMTEFGLLEHKHVKDGGSYSFYGFGANYGVLIDTEGRYQISEGSEENFRGGKKKTSEGVGRKVPNKDSSINNSSIKNNIKENIKENSHEKDIKKRAPLKSKEAPKASENDSTRSKEKQGNKVEQIINEFTDNENLKTAILEYIKMRKLIKSQMTERALKLALKKLKELGSNESEQIHILEQSIMNSWKGLFPLKDQSSKGSVENGADKREDKKHDERYGLWL